MDGQGALKHHLDQCTYELIYGKVTTKKTQKVLDMKSQQRRRAENTAKKAAKKDAAAKKKLKKSIETRKEDVSQLADQLFGLSL